MASTDEPEFSDIDWEQQSKTDDNALQQLLDASQTNGEQSGIFDTSRPLDIGDKADDAEDFEDISDEDLPEEEEAAGTGEGDVPGLTDDMGTSHDTDDLFGEGRGSSPFDQFDDDEVFRPDGTADASGINGGLTLPSIEPEVDLRELNFPEHYHGSNQDPSIPAPAESELELVKQSWPQFERGTICNFSQLLPPQPAHWIPKAPDKRMKPVHPTKVSLDLAPDQEKNFYSAGPATSDKRKRIQDAEAKGLVAVVEESSNEAESDDGFDFSVPDPTEKLGGVSWADLEIICEDWESKINPVVPPPVQEPEEEPDEWDMEIFGHAAKRRKVQHEEKDITNTLRFPVPSFDDFEEATRGVAKRVWIDLNDPYILVDTQEQKPAKRRRIGSATKAGKGELSSALSQRFNLSNDAAYDALKQNHKSKVRATLGNISVEHSLPALRLQWPYYRVRFLINQARAWHRPQLKFNKVQNQPVHFSKPWVAKKKKGLKNHATHEIFKETKDLSLADHYSSATLLEYSEEHPTILSNFGMGNRIINYYRREKADDETRPVPEDKVGDVTLLLPEDRSPFAKFGHVEPGETVRTLHNAMYRAPIFKHDIKGTDFLIIRTNTGVAGMSWHIRNIDHLFVVGQEFPSMEIPSPHSRRVTTAAKLRMKMIGMRKIRHDPHGHLKISDITAHIAESSDMQNRQKLKEFFQYDKTEKVWKMKPGDMVQDEATTRALIKPEEVCALDAMQVGARTLQDAGLDYDGKEDKEGVEDNADDVGEDNKLTADQLLEKNLTPWKTTKAFLDASTEKGMLDLHGAGDPSGCGLAINMIRVSMKGGFQAKGPGATSEQSAKDAQKKNGHGYNVKEQEEKYKRSINEIWNRQKANLSDTKEHAENDMEIEQEDEDRRLNPDQTPLSMATPAGFDDSASQLSRFSGADRSGRAMRIIRRVKNKLGTVEEVVHIVKDPRVWRAYQQRRHAIDNQSTNVYDAKPTGNAEWDRLEAQRYGLSPQANFPSFYC
jgi:transcription initiation factor TFIID subunit 1